MARSSQNIGRALRQTRKHAQALTAHAHAREVYERLVHEHPESTDYASELGMALNSLALIDLDAKRPAEARGWLRKAIALQKKALSTHPRNSTYREFLRAHFINLRMAESGLGNAEQIVAAQRELDELDATDPAKLALDARLTAVLRGEAVKDNGERVQLAYHGYSWKRYERSARLFAEALESEPSLANDRQRQHAYNAACAAALAATAVRTAVAQPVAGQLASTNVSAPAVAQNQNEKAKKPPNDAERCKLRSQARSWLQAELDRWAKALESANEQQRAFVKKTLEHWLEDPDLVSVRDTRALDGLPDDERQQWRRLWDDVRGLLAKEASDAHSQAGRTIAGGGQASGPSSGKAE